MFTGLIETVGKIAAITPKGDVWQIDIHAPRIAHELQIGDSVSVMGACSTVVQRTNDSFSVEIMEETRLRTKLGRMKPFSAVNLERAMRLDSRLDGHLVAGHIDGIANLVQISAEAQTRKLRFTAPQAILSGIVPKGSVTIDGVSLTVIDSDCTGFSVGIIPTTLSETTLASIKLGDE
ncbi:MAG: riboflavin synthase, partial [Synergistaceae bacterium]